MILSDSASYDKLISKLYPVFGIAAPDGGWFIIKPCFLEIINSPIGSCNIRNMTITWMKAIVFIFRYYCWGLIRVSCYQIPYWWTLWKTKIGRKFLWHDETEELLMIGRGREWFFATDDELRMLGQNNMLLGANRDFRLSMLKCWGILALLRNRCSTHDTSGDTPFSDRRLILQLFLEPDKEG